MMTKYVVYWIDDKDCRQGHRYVNDLQEAMYAFLYLSRKHKKVVLEKHCD